MDSPSCQPLPAEPETVAPDDAKEPDLSVEEIDAKVRAVAFQEMQWLWRKFRRLRVPLNDVDDEELQLLRLAHTGTLISRPIVVTLVSVLVAGGGLPGRYPAVGEFRLRRSYSPPSLSLLLVYVFWFAAAFVQRSWIHPWKKIGALELAAMLRRRNFRAWFDRTPGAVSVCERLRNLGVNSNWDNADYRTRYRSAGDRIEPVEVPSPQEFLSTALREVLGSKQERRFQPGRYVDSLKERKRSVTRFVNAHREQLRLNREGQLEIEEGIALLRELRADYLVPGSSGAKFVTDCIHGLERGDMLPAGVVEAKIWDRDPWERPDPPEGLLFIGFTAGRQSHGRPVAPIEGHPGTVRLPAQQEHLGSRLPDPRRTERAGTHRRRHLPGLPTDGTVPCCSSTVSKGGSTSGPD